MGNGRGVIAAGCCLLTGMLGFGLGSTLGKPPVKMEVVRADPSTAALSEENARLKRECGELRVAAELAKKTIEELTAQIKQPLEVRGFASGIPKELQYLAFDVLPGQSKVLVRRVPGPQGIPGDFGIPIAIVQREGDRVKIGVDPKNRNDLAGNVVIQFLTPAEFGK